MGRRTPSAAATAIAASNALPPRSRTAVPMRAARGWAEATMPRRPRASGHRVSQEVPRQAPSWEGLDCLMIVILRDAGRLCDMSDLAERLPGGDRRRGHDVHDLASEGRPSLVDDRAERVRHPPEQAARRDRL